MVVSAVTFVIQKGFTNVLLLNTFQSMQLLDTSLKSSHLPAYLAAAFAKKLGRLGLSASPSGCLVVTAMIHNLLRRHPSVNCLVDGVRQTAVSVCSAQRRICFGDSFHCVPNLQQERVEDNPLAVEGRGTVADPEGNGSAQSPAVLKGADPFVPFETDPSKCLAMSEMLVSYSDHVHQYSERRCVLTVFCLRRKLFMGDRDSPPSLLPSCFKVKFHFVYSELPDLKFMQSFRGTYFNHTCICGDCFGALLESLQNLQVCCIP